MVGNAGSPFIAGLAGGSHCSPGYLEVARTSWKPYAAALFSQLQRASLSVQLTIAEGYAYADSPSFTRHLTIAYGSAVETGELLEVALDAQIVPVTVGKELLPGTSEANVSFSVC